jgi:hypothetical protein
MVKGSTAHCNAVRSIQCSRMLKYNIVKIRITPYCTLNTSDINQNIFSDCSTKCSRLMVKKVHSVRVSPISTFSLRKLRVELD